MTLRFSRIGAAEAGRRFLRRIIAAGAGFGTLRERVRVESAES